MSLETGPDSVPVVIPAGRLAFSAGQNLDAGSKQNHNLVECRWDSWCYEVL